jgi:hypothetical protein
VPAAEHTDVVDDQFIEDHDSRLLSIGINRISPVSTSIRSSANSPA